MCIVVPTFNNVGDDRYIYNIQSILNQNYTNYFVIVVDDHSADNTGSFIQEYLNNNKVIQHKVLVVKRL